MAETIQSLRAQWADGSLSSAQVDDLIDRLASAESRAERAESAAESVRHEARIAYDAYDRAKHRAERAEADVVRLTPSADDLRMLANVSEAIGFEGFGPRYIDELRDAFGKWVARLPAPVDAKGGE